MAGFSQGEKVCDRFCDMKTRTAHILASAIFFAVLILHGQDMSAQNHIRRAMRRARQEQREAERKLSEERRTGEILSYIVENGDTIYFDSIAPSSVAARGRRQTEKDRRQYYRLVYNFAKVYPYARLAAKMERAADSTITANGYGKRQKEKYVNGLQKQIMKDFEKVARSMSISQGALLLKLIDREINKPTYTIIKDYKSRTAAGFWQGIAKLFDNDLKATYDPDGEDKDVEELVKKWEDGTFAELYFSIFWQEPPQPSIPEKYR